MCLRHYAEQNLAFCVWGRGHRFVHLYDLRHGKLLLFLLLRIICVSPFRNALLLAAPTFLRSHWLKTPPCICVYIYRHNQDIDNIYFSRVRRLSHKINLPRNTPARMVHTPPPTPSPTSTHRGYRGLEYPMSTPLPCGNPQVLQSDVCTWHFFSLHRLAAVFQLPRQKCRRVSARFSDRGRHRAPDFFPRYTEQDRSSGWRRWQGQGVGGGGGILGRRCAKLGAWLASVARPGERLAV